MYIAVLTISVLIYASVCMIYLRHPAASWFHPLTFYLAFHGVVFTFRPIMSYYYEYRFIYNLYLFIPGDYVKTLTLIVTNLGLISFAYTSIRWGNVKMTFKNDRASAIEISKLSSLIWFVTVVLAPLIIYSLHQSWLLRSSSASNLIIDRSTGTTINTEGNGYVQSAFLFLILLVPIVAYIKNFRPFWIFIISLAALVMAGTGLRGPIASLAVVAMTLYLYSRRKLRPGWPIIATTIFAFIIFNFVGADRGQSVRTLLTGEQGQSAYRQEALAPLEGMDFGNLEFVEFLVDKVPDHTGTYEYFVDLLQVFTEPVPRVLWHNKPIGQPIRLFYLFDYGNPIGMTRSLPGQGWTELGLAGVVLWCGFWGAMLGIIYKRYVSGPQTFIQTSLYAALIATLIIFYRDGTLITLLKQWVLFSFPIVLLSILAKFMRVPNAAVLRRYILTTTRRELMRKKPGYDADLIIQTASQKETLPRSRRPLVESTSVVTPRSQRRPDRS